jgi:quinol monooxygenase YgiN
MIFITVKFKVRPEYAEDWLTLVEPFTQATRKEPGNLWFDWSRSVDDPNEFVLVEAFPGRAGRGAARQVRSFPDGDEGDARGAGGNAEDHQLRDRG